MRRLTIDQGNTNTKWATFSGKEILGHGRLRGLTLQKLRALVKKQNAQYVILSSTKHLTKSMVSYFVEHENHYILSEKLQFPFVINYETPSTLGKDRVAAIAGAWSLFPSQNSLVIDAGSCVTYDLITAEGLYLGGNISPGVYMRLKAMHEFTSMLPLVKPDDQVLDMGIDTTTALQVGAQVGAAYEMAGFIDQYLEKLNKLNILLTGGDAHFFVNRMKTKIFTSPHLILQGLNEILEYNVQKLS